MWLSRALRKLSIPTGRWRAASRVVRTGPEVRSGDAPSPVLDAQDPNRGRLHPIEDEIPPGDQMPKPGPDVVARRSRQRMLGELRSARRLIVAIPAYLARRGTPAAPGDLALHDCLTLSGHDGLARWPFRVGARTDTVTVRGAMTADSAEALRTMAIAGLGLVRLADFLLQDAVEDGRLVVLLRDCHADEPLPVAALTPAGRARLPRVRAFLDFAAEMMGG